jgi:hypothetical protein
LFHLALSGLYAGLGEGHVKAAMDQINAASRPPLDDREVAYILRSVKKTLDRGFQKPPSYQTIHQALRMTAAEIEATALTRRVMKRRLATNARHAAIREIVNERGGTPSIRWMVTLLGERQIKTSITTIHRDYQRLHLTAPPSEDAGNLTQPGSTHAFKTLHMALPVLINVAAVHAPSVSLGPRLRAA